MYYTMYSLNNKKIINLFLIILYNTSYDNSYTEGALLEYQINHVYLITDIINFINDGTIKTSNKVVIIITIKDINKTYKYLFITSLKSII